MKEIKEAKFFWLQSNKKKFDELKLATVQLKGTSIGQSSSPLTSNQADFMQQARIAGDKASPIVVANRNHPSRQPQASPI